MTDIPLALKKIFEESPLLQSLLDSHGPEVRQILINTVDLHNNPLRKEEMGKFLEGINKDDYLIEIEQAGIMQLIKEWESKATPTAIDYKTQQDNVGALKEQLKALDGKASQLLNVASMTLHPRQGVPKPKAGVKTKNVWNEHALRRLLEESKQPGATHQKLAEKYGVRRQRIAKVIAKAEDLFAPYRANPMSMSWTKPKK